MGLLCRTLFILALCLAVISASNANGNRSCASESQLQALQIELTQLYVRSEEQLEALSTKLHHLQQSLDALTWTAERVEQSVRRLESNSDVLVRNVSLLTHQSDQVLVNQEYCANHEALKELFFDLTPKCVPGATPFPPPPPTTTEGPNNRTYSSCREAPNRSGVYRIAPYWNSSFEAYCEQDRYDGGWIVIQRRQDGSVHFNRSWSEFRNGFGDARGEYWLGLQHQHELTNGRQYELLVVLENATGFQVFERYPSFSVNSESSYYSIGLPSRGAGTAGDSLFDYRGEKFVTYNQAAGSSYFSCVDKLGSGFWHYSCTSSTTRNNLNGIYGRSSGDAKGIWWDTFGSGYSNQLTRVQLMIREVSADTSTRNYEYESTVSQ